MVYGRATVTDQANGVTSFARSAMQDRVSQCKDTWIPTDLDSESDGVIEDYEATDDKM